MNPPSPLLVSLLAASAALGCADLTAPSPYSGSSAAPAGTPAPAASRAAAPAPTAPAPSNAPARIRASHILIAYAGAQRASATRSKDDAKRLATQLLGRIKAGTDFGKLAAENSDDTGNKGKGGDLGLFDRSMMTKPFSDAAFALNVGQTSDVVETEFGFHIIKRTE